MVGKIERKRIIERPVTRKRTKLVLKKIERKRMIGSKVTRNITKLVLKKTGGGKRDCHMERILKSFTMHKTSQCKSLQFRWQEVVIVSSNPYQVLVEVGVLSCLHRSVHNAEMAAITSYIGTVCYWPERSTDQKTNGMASKWVVCYRILPCQIHCLSCYIKRHIRMIQCSLWDGLLPSLARFSNTLYDPQGSKQKRELLRFLQTTFLQFSTCQQVINVIFTCRLSLTVVVTPPTPFFLTTDVHREIFV